MRAALDHPCQRVHRCSPRNSSRGEQQHQIRGGTLSAVLKAMALPLDKLNKLLRTAALGVEVVQTATKGRGHPRPPAGGAVGLSHGELRVRRGL